MKLNTFILSVLATVLCSCGEPEPGIVTPQQGSVTVDVDRISVSYEAQSTTVNVEADCDWGVAANDSWAKVTPSGGISGKTSVKVSIEENKTEDVRETALVFRFGSSRHEVPLKQNYKVEKVDISDAAFKAYLLENFDLDSDGVMSTKEAGTVTAIEASGLGIKAMPEIASAFPNLTKLDCSSNALTELPVSGLTALTYLDCSDNDLTSLDIQLLTALQTFDATGNPGLTTIYVWSDFEEPAGFSKPGTAQYIEPEINTPAGYKLVWRDEFNSSGETSPDSKLWWYETGGNGWGNNELQDYVAGGIYKGEKIAKVADGKLTITAKKIDGKVRSVRMNTSEGWTYGYFEARLKLPKGKGTWPAFWMMPKNFTAWPKDGEIDIMEHVGYHQDYVSSSIHCTAYVHSNGTQKTKERYLKGATDDFHVYALEWTPEYIKSYVDGEQLFYYNPEDYPKGRTADTWPFDAPFYLKLNLAWGGNWGGAMGIDESCLPAVYEIDYVRVFQKVQ